MSTLALTADNAQLRSYYNELDRNSSFWLDNSQFLIATGFLVLYSLLTAFQSFLFSSSEVSSVYSYSMLAFYSIGIGFMLNACRAWYLRYDAMGRTVFNDKHQPGGEGYPLTSMRFNQIFLFVCLAIVAFSFIPSASAGGSGLSVIQMSGVNVTNAATELAKQLIVLGGAVLGGILILFAATAGVPWGRKMIYAML